jgi:2-polyprenyl-6-methoxyphenol hydroxylase-like FAD-dependent oxidoreductase
MSDGGTLREAQETRTADVIVAGAGPVGLWLAAELRLGGATVTVLEKRAQRSPHSRAHTLHARTLEIFASRGIVGPWLAEGIEIPTTHYAMLSSRLDLTGLRSDFPFVLFLPQVRTEELLEQHAIDLGVRVLRGAEVTAIASDTGGVRATAVIGAAGGADEAGGADGADGAETVEFAGRFLVGCDGGRSVVRAASGIGYAGTGDTLTSVVGDVCLDEDTPPAMTLHAAGGSFYAVRIDSTRHRVVYLEHATMDTPRDVPLGFEEFRDSVKRVAGRDFGMRNPTWLTRVGSATFQADRYRQGRTLLAGDAAHVHFPMGGQGLNLGVADAMNLAWKLAAVLRGDAPDGLLDSYQQERAPIGSAVIDDTLAQTAIVAAAGREGQALRGMMTDTLAHDAALNYKLAAFASGTEVTYPPAGPAHPLTGRRVPNLRLSDGGAPDAAPVGDVFGLIKDARFGVVGVSPDDLARHLRPDALASLALAPGGFAAPGEPWDRVRAALIRPDGHLAWAADQPAEADAAGDAAGADASPWEVAEAEVTAEAQLAAEAAAALLSWLPGLGR